MNLLKIDNIKINAFGNIEDKEINFKDGINIVYGKNESGKSTMLSYIINTLYGISKNKDGRTISDYDKYKPWNNEEFSGRIKYELDNKETYEVFRDFNKKNPKIYNDKLEDITKQFDVDKRDGSKFFQEQTGVDKQMYLSTVVSMQQEVRLDDKNQNMLIQKIANLAGTGEDNVSYKKALTKLQEKIRDEIGTNKTTQKPINIVEKEISEINHNLEEIKPYQNKKYDINIEKEEINYNIKELEIEREILLQIKNSIEEENNYKKQIEINENSQKENCCKIQDLKDKQEIIEKQINAAETKIKQIENEIETYKQEQESVNQKIINSKNTADNLKQNITNKNTNKNIVYIIIGALLIALILVSVLILKNYILAGILFILDAIIGVNKIKTQNKIAKTHKEDDENEKDNEELEEKKNIILEKINLKLQELKECVENEKELNNEASMIKGQIILLEKNNEQIDESSNNIKQKLRSLQLNKKEAISEKYKDRIDDNKIKSILDSTDSIENLNSLESKINDEKIRLKGLEIEERTVIPQLDNMVNLKEKLQLNEEKYKQLKDKEEIINIAIENLSEAYEQMKNTITPKFTNSLSTSIEKITNKKYNKVTINDENGMIVENSRGEYIEADKLSTGTIDQLYLSLRLSMINDLSKETLPIILDESFAYFDGNRLENVIRYLTDKLQNHQVIIFTCTNREKEILDKLKLKYNFIEL